MAAVDDRCAVWMALCVVERLAWEDQGPWAAGAGNCCSTIQGLLQGGTIDLNGLSQIKAVGEILPELCFLPVCIKKKNKKKKKRGGEENPVGADNMLET